MNLRKVPTICESAQATRPGTWYYGWLLIPGKVPKNVKVARRRSLKSTTNGGAFSVRNSTRNRFGRDTHKMTQAHKSRREFLTTTGGLALIGSAPAILAQKTKVVPNLL